MYLLYIYILYVTICPHVPFSTPPPQLSTLSPYTTLFRSRRDHLAPRAGRRPERRPEEEPCSRRPRPALRARRPQDRKSTRLNSSHRCISYAVFCLKKKK